MSRLKISSNLFLEVQELQKNTSFIVDKGYKRLIQSMIESYGIVKNSSNTNFKVTAKSGTTNTVVVNSGLAFDSNLDAIVLSNSIEVNINNTGNKRWLILSRDISNYEDGTVSITSDGTLTGTGTAFLDVLRGQPNFPVKIKFNSAQNTGEYEVVSVSSDGNAILSGSFVAESGIQYAIIGTFTPGFQVSDDNKCIYEYDSYALSVVDSSDTPTLSDNQYLLCSIEFDSNGVMTVSDQRIAYMFNNTYLSNSTTQTNPLTSLLRANLVAGVNAVGTVSADVELVIEHGYKISKFSFTQTSATNILAITEGSSNFLGTGDISDDFFKGWILVNRINMKYAVIDSNSNKSLYISTIDSDMIGTTNDLIIVPNFKEIEYEVSLDGNTNNPSVPFYFKKSLFNLYDRLRFYILMPSVTGMNNTVNVTIKYRLVDYSGEEYTYNSLAVAQYINTKGVSETLASSSFSINMLEIEPVEATRNYS